MSKPSPTGPSEGLKQDALRARKFRTPRTIAALVLREMSTTYGRSPGGYLWAILDPVAGLLVMSVIFSIAFRSPPIGTSFAFFYATGFLPFGLFNQIANKMATSISFSKPLLAYPAVTLLDALIARLTLAVLTQLMVGYLIFSALILGFNARAELDLTYILLSVATTAYLGVGIGTLNCYLMTTIPLWERVWQILTRPLFLISGVFFIFSDLPAVARDALWYNPLVHTIGLMRVGFFATYKGDYISVIYVLVIASVTFVLGLLLLWRNHRRLMEK